MEKEFMTGNEFMKFGLRKLCKMLNIEYSDDLVLQHIAYDQSVNEEFQYKIIRTITHDGTLIFTYDLLLKIFEEILNKKTQYKPSLENINLDDIEDIHYTIGDVYYESIYDVKAKGKNFPMMETTLTIPIKSTLIMKEV